MIRRGKHSDRFTILPNAMLENHKLGIDTRGMLAYLISRPENWTVRHDQLRRVLRVTRDRLARMLREAMDAGYIERDDHKQPRDEKNNHFQPYSYTVWDEPRCQISGAGNPAAETRQRKPCSGNKKASLPINNSETPLPPRPSRRAFKEKRWSEAFDNVDHAIAGATSRADLRQRNDAARDQLRAFAYGPETDEAKRSGQPIKSGGVVAAGLRRIGQLRQLAQSPRRVINGDRGKLELEIANRLGADGFDVLMALSPSEVDQLCAQQRRGTLTDSELDRVRASQQIKTGR